MTFVFILVLVVIVVLIVASSSKSGKTNRRRPGPVRGTKPPARKPAKPDYRSEPLPAGLGLQPGVPLKSAADRLEQALQAEYGDRLRKRVLGKYPSMSEAEYEWKLLELKRYFLMTAVLKEVPMFSEAVDDIWHEMLMFTREYQRFGETLLGATIHHAPHTSGTPDPGGRAWFDWVYAHLFTATPFTGQIWGSFFRYPLDRQRIDRLSSESEEELEQLWFNRKAAAQFPEIRQTVRWLIEQAKDQLRQAAVNPTYAERPSESHGPSLMPYLAGAMLFYSVTEFTGFNEQMQELLTEEEAKREAGQQSGASSSCASSGCGSGIWSDNDSGNDDSGSSGNCSSSSCSSSNCSSSSSCSSGCGGGGGD
ncbi:hypothetical protein [Paenibacillus oleatilyticus]|uniref:hypothetical protein n=1 Tax=Paenibacillus oleatilyticus TaxID=2594886 RepID=UPI001C1F329D|nr:hypothetical protein [Paenibacillus oleatilyticus]MBU7319768.1 hypothetical protein [Paenibacillus oleatilyticus]